MHRALASLRRAGFADPGRPRPVRAGRRVPAAGLRPPRGAADHVRISPCCEALAERYGETAHYAVLDGASVVYRAKVDPPHGAVRLTSTIGGRNPAHSTAVGKLLLAYTLPRRRRGRGVGRRPDPGAAHRPDARPRPSSWPPSCGAIRERGFGIDDQENEPGVNCLAVPAFLTLADDTDRRGQRQRAGLPDAAVPAGRRGLPPIRADGRRPQ